MPDYQLAAERAARKYGVDPKIFKAMIRQESGFNPNARSPAGAQGIAQFMPGTAPGYGVNLHDNRVTDDLEGAAKYIAANLKRTGGNYHEALSIYNSGRPQGYLSIPETKNYVAKILGSAGREHTSGAAGAPSAAASSSGQTTKTTATPGVDNSDARRQALSAFLLGGTDPTTGQQTSGDILQLALQMRQLKDTPAQTSTVRTAATSGGAGRASSVRPSGVTGRVKFAPGADRPGVSTQQIVKSFLAQVAGHAKTPINVGTGTNHRQMTLSGNQSDHWTGHAADLPQPVDSHQGDMVAAHVLQVAGVPWSQAVHMAQKGGVFNVTPTSGPYKGHRIQVLWKTNVGGNHHNHVHVGIR